VDDGHGESEIPDRKGCLESNAEALNRIKLDTIFPISEGSHPKHLSRIGERPAEFFLHITAPQSLSDPKINVVIS
jgi:hypothetical protein